MHDNRFGPMLRSLRGSRSRKEVAESCGISEGSLACYESGERIPRDEVKISLSRYYGKPVETIFNM